MVLSFIFLFEVVASLEHVLVFRQSLEHVQLVENN